jgi:hypothetical protein
MAVVAGGTLPLLLLLLLLLKLALCTAHGAAASKDAPSLLLHMNNSMCQAILSCQTSSVVLPEVSGWCTYQPSNQHPLLQQLLRTTHDMLRRCCFRHT